jgi:hypothetical protein
MKQLASLVKKFPKEFVKTAPAGKFGDYIPFPTISQRLLEVCGNYDWDFEIIYSENVPVAIKGILSVEVDGQIVTVSGAGTPQNVSESVGEQIKKMESDAFKRCARNLGLGLHLWSGDNPYWIEVVLNAKVEAQDPSTEEE